MSVRRPRRACRGPLPAGYEHGKRTTYQLGYCRGRQCADADMDYRIELRRRQGIEGRSVRPEEAEGRARFCKRCGALPGEPCVGTAGGRLSKVHVNRLRP